MQTLETDRLSLRWLTKEDAPFMLELLNDPAFIENIADRQVRTVDQAEAYIANIHKVFYEPMGFGSFLVSLKSNGEKLGICSLVKRDGLEDVDIGFAFLPSYTGKGYALESTLEVLKFSKDVLKLPRIVGICNPTNKASIRLLEKIGLRLEQSMRLNDKETLLFGLNF